MTGRHSWNDSNYVYVYVHCLLFFTFNMLYQVLCSSQALIIYGSNSPSYGLSPVKSCHFLRYITPCVLTSNYQQLQETRSFNLQGHFYPTSTDSMIFVAFIKHIESTRYHDSLHFHSHEILYFLMAHN